MAMRSPVTETIHFVPTAGPLMTSVFHFAMAAAGSFTVFESQSQRRGPHSSVVAVAHRRHRH